MTTFSPQTLGSLSNAGWSEGRITNTDLFEAAFTQEGYSVCKGVIEFLREFGGLEIHHPHAKLPNAPDYFLLDPLEGMRGCGKDTVDQYSHKLGQQLWVIGEAYRGNMVLMMSAEGSVYAGRDELLIFIGKGGAEAIENIVVGGPTPEI